MNPELLNSGMQPPEKTERDTDGQLQDLLEWVRKTYKPSDFWDMYEHDREVAIAFKIFVSRYMNGEITEEEPDKEISDNDLWELFCKQ
jgi:hypothetical protein